MKRMDRSCCAVNYSGKNPFAASFDEFIKHHANIIQSKPANIKSKELCGVSRTQFQTNKSWRGMFEARVFHLLGNLIWGRRISNQPPGLYGKIDTYL